MTKQSSSLTEVKSVEPGAIIEELMTRLEILKPLTWVKLKV